LRVPLPCSFSMSLARPKAVLLCLRSSWTSHLRQHNPSRTRSARSIYCGRHLSAMLPLSGLTSSFTGRTDSKFQILRDSHQSRKIRCSRQSLFFPDWFISIFLFVRSGHSNLASSKVLNPLKVGF
jgi:hypothetical protein